MILSFYLQIVLGDIEDADDIRMRIVIAQFNLFVMMCRGSHTDFIKHLEDKEGIMKRIGIRIDFDFLKKAIPDPRYPPELRAKFLQLLRGKQNIICFH